MKYGIAPRFPCRIGNTWPINYCLVLSRFRLSRTVNRFITAFCWEVLLKKNRFMTHSILYYKTIHDVKWTVIHDSQYLRIDSALTETERRENPRRSSPISLPLWQAAFSIPNSDLEIKLCSVVSMNVQYNPYQLAHQQSETRETGTICDMIPSDDPFWRKVRRTWSMCRIEGIVLAG